MANKGFPDQTTSQDLLDAESEMRQHIAEFNKRNNELRGVDELGRPIPGAPPITAENQKELDRLQQDVRDSKINYRELRTGYKNQINQNRQTKRLVDQFRSAVDLKNILNENIYNPEAIQPDYQYMQPQRDAAAQAYKNAVGSRDLLAGSAANIAPYATGEKSYAREQGKLDVNSARNAILSRMAGNRGGGAAAAQLSNRAIGEQGGHIMDQARAQGVQERLGAANALSGLYGNLNQTDLNMNTVSRQSLAQEGAMAQQLADYKYNQELDKQARDQGLFNTVLGRGDADNAQQAALRAEAAAKKNAMWQNITGLVSGAAKAATSFAGG